ncbi:GNAT family N-acetyltransferase [Eleftheria terrae]|uniref:GNAT family N-acetyltransferase n=1 Tax=Eleftheria terrae TaxID=1597781 RepID=UPI00263A6D07|nr:GNAT family N-acetyltransferase [Eleftheria terrae]WKB55027.1 GNAT family N-acetyltransferase [Eleftheria terrae]
MLVIRNVPAPEAGLYRGLCDLLTDCVHGGASVGFLAPVASGTAERYWDQVFAALGPGLQLWVAQRSGRVAGAVQLAPCSKENGRHRAEVQKLLVLRTERRQGVASQLLAAVERQACSEGLRLLVLDTLRGSEAEALYLRQGWQRAGEIPDYAAAPDGSLHPTVYYFKRLPAAMAPGQAP